MPVSDTDVRRLCDLRWRDPDSIATAVRERRRPEQLPDKALIIAADHPARAALAVGGNPLAMANRADLLSRILSALERPGVHGFLGTPDLVEDLAVLGALEQKWVFGSMNRGGLSGSCFELDDRFTGYDVTGISRDGLDGGKMLVRIDPNDEATASTLAACGQAVTDLAAMRKVAMVEPFWSSRVDGVVRNNLSTEAVIRSIAVASGLGNTSAYTWLKIPVADDMAQVAAATTMPLLVLGGDDASAGEQRYARALAQPNVRGLAIGRSLLYPPDDDVAAAVDRVAALI